MVYYNENPDLIQLKVVETVRGNKEYRRNTKYIKEKYYTINRDCFQFDNRWYTIDSGNVIFDNELKTYVLKGYSPLLKRGIVLGESGKLELGYFSINPYNNVYCNSNEFGKLTAINSNILEESGWFEDKGNNVWYNPKDMSSSSVLSRKKIRNEKTFTDRGYNIEENNDYEQKIELYQKYPTHITPKAKEMSKYLGDLTFGIEVELQRGNIGENLRNRLGIVVCRDGSLNGGAELVSVPMSGAKGLQTIVNLSKELKTRGEIGLDCSFHIHFGNFPTDKLSIIALYRLCRNVQNELLTMFPYYKTDPTGIKQKNYTKKLMKLNINSLKDNSKEAYELYLQDSWIKMFDFFAEGKTTVDKFNKRTREHPIQRKWERKSRYYCFNFFNLFFGHRHTIEARLHSGTINSHKMINWMFICVAIIKYALKYSKEIISSDKTIALKEILDIYPTMFPLDKKAEFISKYLYQYFLERQEHCRRDLEKRDYISEWDMEEDTEYKFEYKGVCGLI